ncbi:hypothetical protein IU405_02185 [Polaribacter sp. BAL334]|uniref:hypothetical protein n=1 Tax=Polaribacter sp. BAL334 TaxID=1708178 RepID=UPI0018D25789|nr:hypothetical protein [Polaribacter sp. BAL334]MBG7611047.1 hypothetical protein [Polaribacter sp. BAL334]
MQIEALLKREFLGRFDGKHDTINKEIFHLLIKDKILVEKQEHIAGIIFKLNEESNFIQSYKNYVFNDNIYKEMISNFLLIQTEFILFGNVEKMKIYLSKCLNDNDKIKYLKKKYAKFKKDHIKIGIDNWLSISSLGFDNSLKIGFLKMLQNDTSFSYVLSISIGNKDVLDYLNNNLFNFYTKEPFKEWKKIIDLEYMMEFCLLKIQEINNKEEEKTKINSIEETDIESKYPLVFPNLKAEEMFFKFLREKNGVDLENRPIKGRFQPLCNAYFKVAKEDKNENYNAFTYNLLKKNFIDMLRKEFNIPLSERLSSGGNHEATAQSFLEKNQI